MAKKAVTKRSTTKKKTTKATSRKKTAKKAGASTSSKKKPTTKRTPTKKASTSKKSQTKKSTSKKTAAAASKAPASKVSKKKSTKKAPARKPSNKKTTAKASSSPTTKKTTARKPSASKKPASKAPSKRKPSASGAKSSEKKPTKPKSESKASIKDRWKGSYSSDMTSSVDAATRLAAAAGLRPLHERQTALAASEDYKKLTKTPFKKRELDRFKETLRDKRRDVTGDVNDMETEALVGRGSGSLSKLPQHMADAGSDTYDQTLNLDLASSQRKLLKEIDDALARIENRTYGICELLGKPISKERLENTPWARYSIEGARRKEMLGY